MRIEARRGYFALGGAARDNATAADIEDTIFSGAPTAGIPVELFTSSSKPNNSDLAKILVVAKIEVAALKSMQAGGQGRGSLRVVGALFDSEGAYVIGATEHVSLQQPDPTLTLRWEFPDIKSGSYVLRLVVREQESKATTLMNRTLQIL
jgi:hypothetical protein